MMDPQEIGDIELIPQEDGRLMIRMPAGMEHRYWTQADAMVAILCLEQWLKDERLKQFMWQQLAEEGERRRHDRQ